MWVKTTKRLPPRVHGSDSNDVPIALNVGGDIEYRSARYCYDEHTWHDFDDIYTYATNDVLYWFDLPPLPE